MRHNMSYTKSCGHGAFAECDCPVQDEVWIVPPVQDEVWIVPPESEPEPDLRTTYDKVADQLLKHIERAANPPKITAAIDPSKDGDAQIIVVHGRKNGKPWRLMTNNRRWRNAMQ